MAKSMRNDSRSLAKLVSANSSLVLASLNSGAFTRKDICKATGLKMHELQKLFKASPELFSEYQLVRKSMADIAADNMASIINDPNHPHHFQASKFILQTYKSDLDEILTPQEENLEIFVPGSNAGETSSPVMIKFTKTNKE